MDSELARLATYRHWTPRRSVTPTQLARAGFYHDLRGHQPTVHNTDAHHATHTPRAQGRGAYQRASSPETHNHQGTAHYSAAYYSATHYSAAHHNSAQGPSAGIIRCYACNLVIPDAAWVGENRRDPALIHSHRRPTCPHVTGAGRNRPLGYRGPVLGEHDPRYAVADTPGLPNVRCPPMVPPNDAACHPSTDIRDIDKYNTHAHPSMAHKKRRRDTFKEWPYTLVISPNELAKAGFFFFLEGQITDQGQGHAEGQIVCFHCDGSVDGVRYWAPGKDALSVLEEHMRGSGARCTVAADLRRRLEAMKRGDRGADPGGDRGTSAGVAGEADRELCGLFNQVLSEHSRREAASQGPNLEVTGASPMHRPRHTLTTTSAIGRSIRNARIISPVVSSDDARSLHHDCGVQEGSEECAGCLEPVLIRSSSIHCGTCGSIYHSRCFIDGCLATCRRSNIATGGPNNHANAAPSNNTDGRPGNGTNGRPSNSNTSTEAQCGGDTEKYLGTLKPRNRRDHPREGATAEAPTPSGGKKNVNRKTQENNHGSNSAADRSRRSSTAATGAHGFTCEPPVNTGPEEPTASARESGSEQTTRVGTRSGGLAPNPRGQGHSQGHRRSTSRARSRKNLFGSRRKNFKREKKKQRKITQRRRTPKRRSSEQRAPKGTREGQDKRRGANTRCQGHRRSTTSTDTTPRGAEGGAPSEGQPQGQREDQGQTDFQSQGDSQGHGTKTRVRFCPCCMEHKNRKCVVCERPILSKGQISSVGCSNESCGRWYHMTALTNTQQESVVADLAHWKCPKCESDQQRRQQLQLQPRLLQQQTTAATTTTTATTATTTATTTTAVTTTTTATTATTTIAATTTASRTNNSSGND